EGKHGIAEAFDARDLASAPAEISLAAELPGGKRFTKHRLCSFQVVDLPPVYLILNRKARTVVSTGAANSVAYGQRSRRERLCGVLLIPRAIAGPTTLTPLPPFPVRRRRGR